MSFNVESLPTELSEKQALEYAYSSEINWNIQKLSSGISVLIECEKQLIPWLYMCVRSKLKDQGYSLEFLDGRSLPGDVQDSGSVLRNMILQITYWVRNSSEKKVLVLPHLDLLVSNSANEGLTTEAREILPLLYENPGIVFLAFKDPYFAFSKVVENLFPAKQKLLGIDRKCLQGLVLQREARKFPNGFNFQSLYQYVSGLNPVRLRQILQRLDGIDFPEESSKVISQIREMSIACDMEIPLVDMQKDIGGYSQVKDKLNSEILEILERRAEITDEDELKEIDSIIPKGLIFHGPPGTGKTFFAKAMATSLNASIIIVSGPELKSMWVGQSEENIRKVFFKARQSAPSIIVFDELDSFAGARDSGSSTEVNHSMVNQLLTEMDGFRKEELVFIVGTTNFVSSLDPALLRPGRFELKVEIPFPDKIDRSEILSLYNKRMKLGLDERQLEFLTRKTGETTDAMTGSQFTGDHLNSIMRYLRRIQIREARTAFEDKDLYDAMHGGKTRLVLNSDEKEVVAYHEAGHALVALSIKESSDVERISINSDYTDALGYVQHVGRKNKYVITKKQLLADLIVLMGGREAEHLIFKDISIGSQNDIYRANKLVEEMVSVLGMSEAFGVRVVEGNNISSDILNKRDRAIDEILERAKKKARQILETRIEMLHTLKNELISKETLERKDIRKLFETQEKNNG
ncbi:MAG: ATP-binding protein [Candidatus Cloacimonadota bacterium]|nr:MAG: ATP-binding protein [Candidatus Cloacimonadota bacterium]